MTATPLVNVAQRLLANVDKDGVRPDIRHVVRPGGRFRGEGPVPSWITSAPTLSALAEQLGIPADAFEDTIARWERHFG